MRVSFDSFQRSGSSIWLDLDDHFGHESNDDLTEDEIFMALAVRVMGHFEPGQISSIFLDEYETDEGDRINLVSGDWKVTLREVFDLARWTNAHLGDWQINRVHAVLNDDWDNWIDNLDGISDAVMHEFDEGDYEGFGKEYAELIDSCVSESLEEYVNWEKFGQAMAENYSEVTWQGTTYLLER